MRKEQVSIKAQSFNIKIMHGSRGDMIVENEQNFQILISIHYLFLVINLRSFSQRLEKRHLKVPILNSADFLLKK